MNSPGFLLLILAFGFLWFFLIRPQKRRQVEAARMLNTLDVGDTVITAGGIYGEVTELHEDDVMVRIAPELEVRVARKAIGGVVGKVGEPDEAEDGDGSDAGEPESEAAAEPGDDPAAEASDRPAPQDGG